MLGEIEGQKLAKSIAQVLEEALHEIKQALRDEISRSANEISKARPEISQSDDEISSLEIEISSHEIEISKRQVEISGSYARGKGAGYSDLESEQQEVTEISSEISSDEIEISAGEEISSEISSEIADQPKPLNAKAVAAILRSNPELLKMRGKDLADRFGVTPVVITRARKLVDHG